MGPSVLLFVQRLARRSFPGDFRPTTLESCAQHARTGFAASKTKSIWCYGLASPHESNWNSAPLWEDAPTPDEAIRLGSFEIPRSQQRGSFGIENPTLLSFLKAHRTVPVTILIVRETTQVAGSGPGLTHMFASDSHPESVGPTLEFSLTN